ncbi:hypothetical protein, partial [Desulfosporosinus metallidurans]
EAYLNKINDMDKAEIIGQVREFANMRLVYHLLTKSVEPLEEQMEYLMKFQEPLFVIAHSWNYENSFSMQEELEHHLWETEDRRNEEADYDLLPDDEQEGDPEVEPC